MWYSINTRRLSATCRQPYSTEFERIKKQYCIQTPNTQQTHIYSNFEQLNDERWPVLNVWCLLCCAIFIPLKSETLSKINFSCYLRIYYARALPHFCRCRLVIRTMRKLDVCVFYKTCTTYTYAHWTIEQSLQTHIVCYIYLMVVYLQSALFWSSHGGRTGARQMPSTLCHATHAHISCICVSTTGAISNL